jgi:hypothetical protein
LRIQFYGLRTSDQSKKIDIENADNINNLYADPEFKNLNARCAEEALEELKSMKELEPDDSELEYPEEEKKECIT